MAPITYVGLPTVIGAKALDISWFGTKVPTYPNSSWPSLLPRQTRQKEGNHH